MKAFLHAQFNPAKTMQQLIHDRSVYRTLLGGALLVGLFL